MKLSEMIELTRTRMEQRARTLVNNDPVYRELQGRLSALNEFLVLQQENKKEDKTDAIEENSRSN